MATGWHVRTALWTKGWRRQGDGNRSALLGRRCGLEGGYVARALGHSIFTEADSWDELKTAIRDAVLCHFEDDDQPELIRLHAVREEVVLA